MVLMLFFMISTRRYCILILKKAFPRFCSIIFLLNLCGEDIVCSDVIRLYVVHTGGQLIAAGGADVWRGSMERFLIVLAGRQDSC